MLILFACSKDNIQDVSKCMRVEILDKSKKIYADSISSIKLKIVYGCYELLKDDLVKIKVSNGVFYIHPFDPSSTGFKDLDLYPFAYETELLIKSNTLNPEDSVYVSATLFDVTKYAVISFLPSFPDNIFFKRDKVFASQDEDLQLELQMFKEKGYTSNNIKVNIKYEISNDTSKTEELLVNVPEFVLTKNNGAIIPIDILQFAKNSRMKVTASIKTENETLIEKMALITFK